MKEQRNRKNSKFNFILKIYRKLLSQRIRKRYCKTLGTSVIYSSVSPPSLVSPSRGDRQYGLFITLVPKVLNSLAWLKNFGDFSEF